MYLYCLNENCRKSHIVCIYSCKDKIKTACPEYTKNYEQLQLEEITDFYKNKYGEPSYPVPDAVKKKIALLSKKQKEQSKLDKELARLKKKKEKAKLKKQKSLFSDQKRLAKQAVKDAKQKAIRDKIDAKIAEKNLPKKAKRFRRTKAEMLVAENVQNNFFD